MIQTKKTRRLARNRALALGFVLAMLAASLLFSAKPAHAAKFAVNSTADTDDGSCEPLSTTIPFRDCTLREAIKAANTTFAADTIGFDIPGDRFEVRTISLTSELPTITSPLTIDGYTQRGSRPNTLERGNDAVLLVELTGQNAGAGADGLAIDAANSTVRGLAINSFSGGQGVLISGARATNNRVEGNFIGTDAAGTGTAGSGMIGVHISHAPGNTVGGTSPGARNVISGNSTGILIRGPEAAGNQVLGNYVGTDRNGSADLGNSAAGVDIRSSGNNTVGGATPGARNVISGNFEAGIRIRDGTSNTVEGNFVGTNASGTQAVPNDLLGVEIAGPGNTVGGAQPGAGNVISGNNGDGVFVSADDSRVQGNHIGTDATGTQALGNSDAGVLLNPDASGNAIGGAEPGAGNIISGNASDGISIFAGTDNEVKGNLIGTDATGTQALGNDGAGVSLRTAFDASGNIADATGNVIGGTEAGAGNVISGNQGSGVFIFSVGTTNNRVEGNLIGTRKDGRSPLGNSGSGVSLSASGNFVGGATPEAANTIAFNGEDGVTIVRNEGTEGVGNSIPRNSIFSNTDLGIDLADDGPTTNDFGDFDTGPNGLQNFPVLDSARTGSRTTTIKGTLRSVPNQTFVLRFFKNPSEEDEGKTFVGKKSVTTDADGIGPFSLRLKGAKKIPVGKAVTATATDPDGNTSEFSVPRRAVAS
jgi:CSLREA domain-containing protein